LAEEMKKKYGRERGSRIIIIKCITNATIRMATKIMVCKLLRKCKKEEVPFKVFIVAAPCVEGTTLSWAPYLLNLFLEDWKNVKDLGIEFQYSWLLILMAIHGYLS